MLGQVALVFVDKTEVALNAITIISCFSMLCGVCCLSWRVGVYTVLSAGVCPGEGWWRVCILYWVLVCVQVKDDDVCVCCTECWCVSRWRMMTCVYAVLSAGVCPGEGWWRVYCTECWCVSRWRMMTCVYAVLSAGVCPGEGWWRVYTVLSAGVCPGEGCRRVCMLYWVLVCVQVKDDDVCILYWVLVCVQVKDFCVKCLTEVWNLRYSSIHCCASLLAGLAPYQVATYNNFMLFCYKIILKVPHTRNIKTE